MNIETGRTIAAAHAVYSRASCPFVAKYFLECISHWHDEHLGLDVLLVQGFLVHIRHETDNSSDAVNNKYQARYTYAIELLSIESRKQVLSRWRWSCKRTETPSWPIFHSHLSDQLKTRSEWGLLQQAVHDPPREASPKLSSMISTAIGDTRGWVLTLKLCTIGSVKSKSEIVRLGNKYIEKKTNYRAHTMAEYKSSWS